MTPIPKSRAPPCPPWAQRGGTPVTVGSVTERSGFFSAPPAACSGFSDELIFPPCPFSSLGSLGAARARRGCSSGEEKQSEK